MTATSLPTPGESVPHAVDFDALVVESLSTDLLDLPLVRPHRVAVATLTHQSVLLIRLRTTSGIEGIGEAVVPGGPWWGGESIEGIAALIEKHVAPLVIGRDLRQIETVVRTMERTIAGARFAKAGVEMAMWDARARAMNVPLGELFGGLSRDAIPVTWALGVTDSASLIDEINQKLASGEHASFKLKMGGADPRSDVDRISRVAEALRDHTSLRVDLNGSWDELTATRWLPALQDAGIDIIEQPVPAWNVEAMARLADRLTVPIMADESLLTPQDAIRLTTLRAADLFAVKIPKSGGLSAVTRIVTIAETAGIGCHGGTTIETSIGTSAHAHLFCALPGLSAGSELFGPLLLADDIVEQPVTYVDGHVAPPKGIGLGMTVDPEKVARYRRR